MSVLRFTALYPSSVPSAVFDTIGCPFGLFSEPLEALSELLSPEFRAPRPFLQSSLRSLLVHGFGVSLTIICLISAFGSRIQDPGPSENHPGVENCITWTRGGESGKRLSAGFPRKMFRRFSLMSSNGVLAPSAMLPPPTLTSVPPPTPQQTDALTRRPTHIQPTHTHSHVIFLIPHLFGPAGAVRDRPPPPLPQTPGSQKGGAAVSAPSGAFN